MRPFSKTWGKNHTYPKRLNGCLSCVLVQRKKYIKYCQIYSLLTQWFLCFTYAFVFHIIYAPYILAHRPINASLSHFYFLTLHLQCVYRLMGFSRNLRKSISPCHLSTLAGREWGKREWAEREFSYSRTFFGRRAPGLPGPGQAHPGDK